MRNYLLILLLSSCLPALATTWTITSVGFAFSPSTITIQEGDTVVFDIDDIHNAQEVSMTTWNNNGTTPLPGGFSLPLGGGMVLPADLTPGTHFYVCQPHASMGMKGMIIVESTTGTSEDRAASAMKVYPNPSTGLIHLSLNGNAPLEKTELTVYDAQGNKVDAILSLNGSTGSLDLTHVAKGIYFIRFRHEGEVYTRKLVTY